MTSGNTDQNDQGPSVSGEPDEDATSLQRDSTRVLPRPSMIGDAPVDDAADANPDAEAKSDAETAVPEGTHDSEASAGGAAPNEMNTGAADGARAQEARLSDEDADRFAASIRPSWEPTTAVPHEVAVAPAGRPPAIDDRSGGDDGPGTRAALRASDPFVADDARISIHSIAGRRPGRQRLLMAAGAIASFALLGVLMLSNTEPEPTIETWDESAAAPQPLPAATRATATEPMPREAPAAPVSNSPPEATIQAIPEVPAAAEEPAAGEDTKAAPPPPPQVSLRVTVAPKAARLSIDGKDVEHPYSARANRGTTVRLQAVAKGYESRALDVQLKENRRIALRLEKKPRSRVTTAPRPTLRKKPRPKPQARAKPPAPKPTPVRPKTKTTDRSRGAGFVTESPY